MHLDIEIPEAIEANIGNVLVPSLQGYHNVPATDVLSIYPFVIDTGTFCQTFPMFRAGESVKKCLRMWVNDKARKDNLSHIKEVSAYFNQHNVDYVVRYEYVDQALRLKNGSVIPGVVMDWIEGDTLIKYVKKNYRNAMVMRRLAKAFRDMVDYLNRNGMAHGDLSGNNIMVTPQGRLYLIDYDSFYVRGQRTDIPQPTNGVAAFQHPGRENNRYLNTYMDHFSQQLIYLSLIAIAEIPDIFNEDADKDLVFQEMDLISEEALRSSRAFINMATIRNQEVQDRLKDLRTDIAQPFEKVRSLTAIYEWEAEMRRSEEVRSRKKPRIDEIKSKNKETVKQQVRPQTQRRERRSEDVHHPADTPTRTIRRMSGERSVEEITHRGMKWDIIMKWFLLLLVLAEYVFISIQEAPLYQPWGGVTIGFVNVMAFIMTLARCADNYHDEKKGFWAIYYKWLHFLFAAVVPIVGYLIFTNVQNLFTLILEGLLVFLLLCADFGTLETIFSD